MVSLNKYFIESENIGVYEQIFEGVYIIDAHSHIGVDRDGHSMTAVQLIRQLDKNGINESIIFPLNDPQAGLNYTMPNDRIFRAYKAYKDRFIPFFRLNPNNGWRDEFTLRVDQGFQGVKLHPRSQDFAITGSKVMKIYEKMEQSNLLLLIHAGFGLDYVAEELNIVAKTFPKLRIILGHGGFPDLQNVIKLLASRENVFFESSTMRVFDLLELLKHIPYKRIVFGSDIPYYDQTLALQMLIDSGSLARHGPGHIRSILGENIQRWLK